MNESICRHSQYHRGLMAALEPRIMYDGAGGAAAEVVDADPAEDGHAEAPQPEDVEAAPDSPAKAADADGSSQGESASEVVAALQAPDRREAAVVASDIVGKDALIDALPQGLTVIELAPEDGVRGLAGALSTQASLDAIHLFTHSREGSLLLGSDVLSAETLPDHAESLEAVGSALAEGGDLLLYGCDLAAGEGGGALVRGLAEITGADVAASTDDTGSEGFGGDWDLESVQGQIEAESITPTAYDGLLGTPSLEGLTGKSFTEGQADIWIADGALVSNGANYGDGSIEFSVSTNGDSGDSFTLTSDASPLDNGSISVTGTAVYLGQGGSKLHIGNIHGTYDGEDGQPLRIDLLNATIAGTSPVTNGDFSGGLTGWHTLTGRVDFGSDLPGTSIATPSDGDVDYPSQTPNADNNAPISSGTPSVGVEGGRLKLQQTGITTAQGYDVVHGPSAYSDAFSADGGMVLRFDWEANYISDNYHVCGYLVDASNNVTIALDSTGSTGSGTASVTVPTTDTYQFVFVSGTFDASGGQAAGASMFIDNIRVEDPAVTDAVVQSIVRQVTYGNDSDDPAAGTKQVEVELENNFGGRTSDTLNLGFTAVNDAPAIGTNTGLTLNEGATATLNASHLNEGDPDDSGIGLTYTLTDLPENGTLKKSGTALESGDTFTQADLNGDRITYTHDGSETLSDGFDFSLADGGEDGVSPASGTFNITVNAVDDAPVLEGGPPGDGTWTEDGAAVAVAPDLTITDVDGGDIEGAMVSIDNLFAGDTLHFSNQNGISGSYNGATGVLTLSGSASAADYEGALRSVTFSSTLDEPDTTDRTVTITLGSALSFSETGHFYEYVSGSLYWTQARDAAAARNLYGLQGYLATVTSQAENDYIEEKLQADAWIGASDQAFDEGTWKWVTGPEAGTTFYTDPDNGGSGTVTYANWNPGEPNNSGGDEGYGQIYSTIAGRWNDLSNTSQLGYVVEYGGMPGESTLQLSASRTIHVNAVNDAPLLDDAGTPSLAAVSEDALPGDNPGTLVSGLLGAAVTDSDSGAVEGMAVTAAESGHGTWQYSTNGGADWSDLGDVSATSARLLASDAATRLRFLPDAEWSGTAAVSYRAWDQTAGTAGTLAGASSGGGTSAFSTQTETASIAVNPVNDPPVPADDAYSVDEDHTLSGGTVLANDSDLYGGAPDENDTPLTAQLVSNVSHGDLTLNADGAFSYTPEANYNGEDAFTYRAEDADGDPSEAATVRITVNPVNDAPEAVVPGAQQVDEDTDLVFSAASGNVLTVSDVDVAEPGGGDLRVTLSVEHGTLTLGTDQGLSSADGDGSGTVTVTGSAAVINNALDGLIYQGDLNFNTNEEGAEALTLVVNDQGNTGSGGGEDQAQTVDITVDPVNDAPVSSGTPGGVPEGTVGESYPYGLGADAFRDVDAGDTLTYTARGLPPGVTFDPSTLSFRGTPQQAGSFRVVVRAVDRGGLAAELSLVIPVVEAPASDPVLLNIDQIHPLPSGPSPAGDAGGTPNEPLTGNESPIPMDAGTEAGEPAGAALLDALAGGAEVNPLLGLVDWETGSPAMGPSTAPSTEPAAQAGSLDGDSAGPADQPLSSGRHEHIQVLPDGRVAFGENHGNDLSEGLVVESVKVEAGLLEVRVVEAGSNAAAFFTATLSDGSPLPSWLSVDPATGTLLGTPPEGVSRVELRIMGTDASGRAFTLDLGVEWEPKQAEEDMPASERPQSVKGLTPERLPFSRQLSRAAEALDGYGQKISMALA